MGSQLHVGDLEDLMLWWKRKGTYYVLSTQVRGYMTCWGRHQPAWATASEHIKCKLLERSKDVASEEEHGQLYIYFPGDLGQAPT